MKAATAGERDPDLPPEYDLFQSLCPECRFAVSARTERAIFKAIDDHIEYEDRPESVKHVGPSTRLFSIA